MARRANYIALDSGIKQPLIRYLLTEALTLQGYDVGTAENGEDALATLRQQPPDLVISDCQMPVMDGFTLLRALRQDMAYTNIKVIMISGGGYTNFFREIAIQNGAQDFVGKPLDLVLFLEKVANLIA